ncbi:hypothetical protein [Streptomyces lateritius]|uniref:hypothetical protein n=1 Tax=Streptomyces lateritius TaxID=67313 RepID=UPI0019C7D393|nr:hypothetical protein [Streptomyces lateritius]GGT76497.1 hypothetical protein GCM10010272_20010 [Streptomyces lateritius]
MSTESHRPTSRITDALLPTPSSLPPKAPEPHGPRPTGVASAPLPAEVPSRPAPTPGTAVGAGAATGSRPEAQVPPVETTTRLRPIRDHASAPAPRPPHHPEGPRPAPSPPPHGAPHVSTGVPRPASAPSGAGQYAYGTYGAYRPSPYPGVPETPAETTTRLRPVRERRSGRVVAAGACLVLGLGLIGGAVAGAVLAATDAGAPAEPAGYAQARTLWHSVPVDTLFPRTLPGPAAGPGAATRTWTRVVVAADAPCSATVLSPSLLTALRPVGCDRVLRATYTDATATSVITVGLVFTQADPATTRTLSTQAARLGADVPPALSAPGTVAAHFGAAQRASWWTRPLADLPVVVTSVSGFADGRPVTRPEPAEKAMTAGSTSAPAQAGLGHEARGVANRVERQVRTAVADATKGEDEK